MISSATLRRNAARIQWTSLAVLALALVLLARALPVQVGIDALERWLAGRGLAGIAIFVLIYTAAALLFVPGAALTLAAGALFGLASGTAAASLASTATAALAFLIARHLARGAIERRAAANPRFRALDRAIEQGGWRIIALLRLSPAMPFSLGNYLFGLTAVRFWPYVLASWIAMLPGTFLYVYLGHLGRESLAAAGGAKERGLGQWALLVIGLLATLAVTVYVTRLARRALREKARLGEEPRVPMPEDAPRGTPWTALASAVLALVASSAAVFAWTKRDQLRHLFGAGAPESGASSTGDGERSR